MLTIAEEILLLVLDDETGKLNTKLSVHSLRNAVSGALLMDLAFDNRIDTDPHRLTVINSTPLGGRSVRLSLPPEGGRPVLVHPAPCEKHRQTSHRVVT